MIFTRENYEYFVVDYLEGNLSARDMIDFKSFLNLNPDLNNKITSFNELTLSPADKQFHDKKSLKKTNSDLLKRIPQNEFNCISYLENDLNSEESHNFEDQLIKNPDLQELLKTFEKSILKPVTVHYTQKKQLKKPVALFYRRLLWIPYAAASVIFILFLMKTVFFRTVPAEKVTLLETPAQQENRNSTTDKDQSPGNLFSENSTVAAGESLQSGSEDAIVYISKTQPSIDNNTTAYTDAEISARLITSQSISTLKSRPGTIPVRKFNLPALQSPTIYIPEDLNPQVLAAFEAYTIEDFQVKLVKSASNTETRSPILVSIANAGIKGANKLTGGNMQLNTASDNKGKLTAFAFNSKGLKISSDLRK